MSNINVSRLLVGGGGEAGRSLLNPNSSGGTPSFFRAVVEEIFFDPSIITPQEIETLKSTVSNPQFVDLMPPMSLMVRISNNSQDLIDSTPSIVYPFFSSHISLPIQSGEVVSIIYEDYKYLGSSLGRWLARPHENLAVEDLNFTHSDRAFDMKNTQAGLEEFKQNRNTSDRQPIDMTPGFPNGADVPGRYTIQPRNPNENPFKTIRDSSAATRLHNFEAIPRYRKNPKDLVLQGSNNTLVVLGVDKEKSSDSGLIDIVSGRGRIPNELNATRTTDESKTAGFAVRNKFGNLEIDKTPFQRERNDREAIENEGKWNLNSDAARIRLATNSKIDELFKLDPSVEGGIRFPTNTLSLTQPTLQNSKFNNGYFIAKSDHIRLVARKSGTQNIKGTILFIKEGSADTDLSYFFINEEGKVQIEGNKIYLGKATQETEPYIKYSVYEKHLNELKAQISNLADQINVMATAYDSAFKSSIAVPFSPIASLVAVGVTPAGAPQTTAKTTQIKAKINSIEPSEAKSNKIFGE